MRHSMAIKLEIGPTGRSIEVETTVSYLCDVDSEPDSPSVHIVEVTLPVKGGSVSAPWLEAFLLDDGTSAALVENARQRRLAA